MQKIRNLPFYRQVQIMSSCYIKVLHQQIWIEQIKVNLISNTPTIVFLHEGLGSVEQWKNFPKKVCEALGMNGLVYDRQGHGRSSALKEKREKDYLHIEALQFLPEILKQLGIEKPILFGHSDGGTIALIYAAHFPKSVRAVATEAAHIKVEEVTLQGIEAAIKLYETTTFAQKLQKYHAEKTDDLFRAWADVWLSESFRDWNIADLLSQIECSVLLLQGKEDEYATEQHLWDIAAGLGESAKAVLLEDCGHSPHREQEERVLKELDMFF